MSRDSYAEIVRILLHHPDGFDAKIREFSGVRCDDPQLPLMIVHSLISDAFLHEPQSPKIDLNRLIGRVEYDALIDIVNNSLFDPILVVDSETHELRFRDDCPLSERIEIGEYVVRNTGGMASRNLN